MFQTAFNPFANMDLRMPVHLRQKVRDFSRQQAGGEQDVPFNRMVDAWLIAVAVGAMGGTKVQIGPSGIEMEKFVTGQVLQNNTTAIAFLLNLAIDDSDDPYVVNEPARVIAVAEQYAAAGFDSVMDMLNGPQISPTRNLTQALIEVLRDADTGEPEPVDVEI